MLLCPACYKPSRQSDRCSWSGCRGRPRRVEALSGLVFDEALGRGSFGDVYGFRAPDGRERAVKIVDLRALAADAAKRSEVQGTFSKERQAYERMNGHPNIVGFHGAFEVGDARLLVLDRVPVTLRHVVGQGARMGLARATQIASDLADALAYAHAKGIVHRDVKPDNVGLDALDRAVLFDFGIARLHDGAGSFTARGMGSLLFAAPEQLLDEAVGAAADVYGWAAVVFRLVTGLDHRRMTLRQGYTRDELVAFLDQPHVPLPADESRPAALDTLLVRCLARRPDDRAPDMAKVQAQMEAIAWMVQTGLPDLRAEVARAQDELQAARRAVDDLRAESATLAAGLETLRREHRREAKALRAARAELAAARDGARLDRLPTQAEGPSPSARSSAEDSALRSPSRRAPAVLSSSRLATPPPGAEVYPATAHRSALVYIPGTGPEGYLMGSPKDEDGRGGDETQHRVVLSPFLLTVTPITQGEFAALTGERPSYFDGADALPVERVSWYDAVAYANALSAKEGLDPCYDLKNPKGTPFAGLEEGDPVGPGDYQAEVTPILDRAGRWRCTGYRLPTESEWEWAARGGTTTRYWKGDAESDLATVGWYDGNSGRKTHPVAAKGADARNPFGLYDVHGNVWEWCHDRYDSTYPTAKQTDPLVPDREGAGRVLRGGSWFVTASWARSAYRSRRHPAFRSRYTGFRLARPVPPSSVLVH